MTEAILGWINGMYEEGRDNWVNSQFNGSNFQEQALKNAYALGACRAYLSILEIDFVELNQVGE